MRGCQFRVLGIDLAASHSAVVVLEEDHSVVLEWDSTDHAFLPRIAHYLRPSGPGNYYAFIEDIPPIQRFDINAKRVCRLQGMLIATCRPDRIVWVPPNEWKRWHGLPTKAGKLPMKEKCVEFGYAPPSSVHGKALTDYRDAYLLARYGVACLNDEVPKFVHPHTKIHETHIG